MILVSVIVPIYNQEKYLEKSLLSLLNQNYSNLEIILVNDGSTDDSLPIIKKYEERDSRIKIIDKENGGVSSARNAGLEIAKGDYIGFVDPDDWVESEMYSSMLSLSLEEKAEVVMCNYLVEKNASKNEIILETKKTKLFTNEILDYLAADMINMNTLNISSPSIMGSVCRMLIKRDLIYNNNIRFDEAIPYMEDLVFAIEILLNTKRVGIDDNLHYHYNQIEGSASNKYLPNFLKNHKLVFNRIENLLIDYGYINRLGERLKYRYVFMIMHSIRNETESGNDLSLGKKLDNIKEMLEDKKLQNYINEIDYKSYSLQRKLILYGIENKKYILLYSYYALTNWLRNINLI